MLPNSVMRVELREVRLDLGLGVRICILHGFVEERPFVFDVDMFSSDDLRCGAVGEEEAVGCSCGGAPIRQAVRAFLFVVASAATFVCGSVFG